MRITFISQYFFPEQFSNNAIALDMVSRGHDVDVVCCVPNYPAGRFFEGYSNAARRTRNWRGLHILRVRTLARGTGLARLLGNYLMFVLAGCWTVLRGRVPRSDVAFISMPSPLTQALVGIALKWRYGVPLVYWVQDIWPESATDTLGLKHPLIVRPLEWLCGWIYRRADLILVQSAAFPPMITRFGVDPDRIRVFPNTAPEAYRPIAPSDAPAQAALVPQTGFRLMFAGNVGESQDFDTLLAAAVLLRDVPDLHWVIVGDGRDLARVTQAVIENGLTGQVHFLGRHPQDSMPYFFAHADAMLVSLKSTPIFARTVPYKVQCYMACGKPIIASLDGEGARIVTQAGAGLAVDAESPAKLADAVRRAVAMPPQERAKLGANALAYFDAHFDASHVYGQLDAWLHEIGKPS